MAKLSMKEMDSALVDDHDKIQNGDRDRGKREAREWLPMIRVNGQVPVDEKRRRPGRVAWEDEELWLDRDRESVVGIFLPGRMAGARPHGDSGGYQYWRVGGGNEERERWKGVAGYQLYKQKEKCIFFLGVVAKEWQIGDLGQVRLRTEMPHGDKTEQGAIEFFLLEAEEARNREYERVMDLE